MSDSKLIWGSPRYQIKIELKTKVFNSTTGGDVLFYDKKALLRKKSCKNMKGIVNAVNKFWNETGTIPETRVARWIEEYFTDIGVASDYNVILSLIESKNTKYKKFGKKDNMTKFFKKLNWGDITSYLFLAFVIFLVVKFTFGGLFGYSMVVISNGPGSSMYPTYDKGDMFIIHKASPEDIHMGDVIVYDPATIHFGEKLIIHRVINVTIIEEGGTKQYYYRVSGDNALTNTVVDTYDGTTTLIPYDAVVGKTLCLIPKLGYLRLWIEENVILRMILIFTVIGLAAYILFAPENKDKKKIKTEHITSNQSYTKQTDKDQITLSTDQNEQPIKEESDTQKQEERTKNKTSITSNVHSYFNTKWTNFKHNTISLWTDKKKRMKVFITVGVILFLLIMFPIVKTITADRSLETGVYDITIVESRIVMYNNENITFLPYTIYFSHDGSWNKVIKSFFALCIQDGTVVSTMEWYSYRQVEGDVIIGGSFIIPFSSFNITEEFSISIHYTLEQRIGENTNNIFEKTFQLYI